MRITDILVSVTAAAGLATGVYWTSSPAETLTLTDPAPVVLTVGGPVPPDDLHLISNPGLYGLGPTIPGSRYGVAGNRLVRVDENTHEIKAVLWMQNSILD